MVIPLLVGEEVSLAATKTMLASLQAAAQFVQALVGARDELPHAKELPVIGRHDERVGARARRPSAVGGLALDGLTVVGRGLGLRPQKSARSRFAKSRVYAPKPMRLPDLLHGPIGADGSGSTLWLILTDEIDDAAQPILSPAPSPPA